MAISRRELLTVGSLAATCSCFAFQATPKDRDEGRYEGCVFSQVADSTNLNSDDALRQFPELARIDLEASFELRGIIAELRMLLGVTPALGLYNDSVSCNGNAGVHRMCLFPSPPNAIPPEEGTIALGTKLLGKIDQQRTAAAAAVISHEFGHMLQFKYAGEEVKKIMETDKNVARVELSADYICGYYAGFRTLAQDDWPAALQALNQFRSGDRIRDTEHHGTPEERARAVRAGYDLGIGGIVPPKRLARLSLDYVKSLTLDSVHSDPGCESIGVKQ